MCSERFRQGGPLGVYTPTALSRGSGWRAMTSFWYEALESDRSASRGPFDENRFAPFERQGELPVAQRNCTIAEHFGAPAVKRGHAVVLVRRKPLDILGVGDEPRRHAGGLGAVAKQGFQQIDRRRRRLALAACAP